MTSQSNRTPLGIPQKMFIQRMLAEHCWTEAQAEQIYQEGCGAVDDHHDHTSLVDLIKWCNSHLSDFGLEIVSVTIPDYQPDETKKESPEDRPHSRRSTGTSSSATSGSTKYYTMVNQFPDTITKDVYQNYLFQPPSLQSYVKLVLSHLAQSYPQPAARATLLNLKNHHHPDDADTSSPKVTLTLAEDMLERLLDEQWLMPVVPVDSSTPPRAAAAAKIVLGPRAWGELSYFVTTSSQNADEDDAATPPRLWPQPIYIRY